MLCLKKVKSLNFYTFFLHLGVFKLNFVLFLNNSIHRPVIQIGYLKLVNYNYYYEAVKNNKVYYQQKQ